MRRLSVALAVLCLTGLLAGGASSWPQKVRPLRLKETYCLSRRDRAKIVRFQTADHVRLIGVTIGSGRIGVVLGHEVDGTLCNWVPFARVLARRGYRALAFDFRNAGSSGHVYASSRSWRWDLDYAAAVATIRSLGASRVVVAGASAGGTGALVAASEISPAIDAVASLSGPAYWNPALVASKTVPDLMVPVLYMVGKDDVDFVGDVESLYRATKEADKQLSEFPNGLHGAQLLSTGAARNVLLAFIRSHAG
jgi:pimeloyl-ACP methyl ester carboxylesterase